MSKQCTVSLQYSFGSNSAPKVDEVLVNFRQNTVVKRVGGPIKVLFAKEGKTIRCTAISILEYFSMPFDSRVDYTPVKQKKILTIITRADLRNVNFILIPFRNL